MTDQTLKTVLVNALQSTNPNVIVFLNECLDGDLLCFADPVTQIADPKMLFDVDAVTTAIRDSAFDRERLGAALRIAITTRAQMFAAPEDLPGDEIDQLTDLVMEVLAR